jgi:hypothetical protein
MNRNPGKYRLNIILKVEIDVLSFDFSGKVIKFIQLLGGNSG